MTSIKIKRKREKFFRDISRVIVRFNGPSDPDWTKDIIKKILKLPLEEIDELLVQILDDFGIRHQNIEKILLDNYLKIHSFISPDLQISYETKLLIGSYFSKEYAIEAAALFNPSIIPQPNGYDPDNNSQKVYISLRATGEGHISSIVFRSGTIDKNSNIILDTVKPYVETPRINLDRYYDKDLFIQKLSDLNLSGDIINKIFYSVQNSFKFSELMENIKQIKQSDNSFNIINAMDLINWVAESNYIETFRADTEISERVIYPYSRRENNGIEDARFVLFTDEEGEKTYYATYTGYNGESFGPMLLETTDFLSFHMCTLNGPEAQGKGMALFPRKINGLYTMISRQDGHNLFIMQSDNIHFWYEKKLLVSPKFPWEFRQIGNCGSPIETTEGWILLTHGVGPLRRYSIGAILLDLNDPSKIIGQLKNPLMTPNENEREGYVPNVLYTCGFLLHNGILFIPYACSDTFSGIATISLKALLAELLTS